MRGGVVVFLGVFGALAAAASYGCSSSTAPSTFGGSDAGPNNDDSCKVSPIDGSQTGNCACSSLAEYCASGSCPMTLADADDAGTWASAGPQPNCYILQSTNACSGTIEVAQRGGVDTSETFFYDQTTGALVGASRVVNLKATCGGTMPSGDDCADIWTLAPIFGVLDGGVCVGNGGAGGGVDSGDAD